MIRDPTIWKRGAKACDPRVGNLCPAQIQGSQRMEFLQVDQPRVSDVGVRNVEQPQPV